jgi:hypothetical protein
VIGRAGLVMMVIVMGRTKNAPAPVDLATVRAELAERARLAVVGGDYLSARQLAAELETVDRALADARRADRLAEAERLEHEATTADEAAGRARAVLAEASLRVRVAQEAERAARAELHRHEARSSGLRVDAQRIREEIG